MLVSEFRQIAYEKAVLFCNAVRAPRQLFHYGHSHRCWSEKGPEKVGFLAHLRNRKTVVFFLRRRVNPRAPAPMLKRAIELGSGMTVKFATPFPAEAMRLYR
jgi:hypothetical protein